MSLGQRLALSIFAILLFFSINVASYFWGSEVRREGFSALQKSVGSQQRAAEVGQELEVNHKKILFFATLKETTDDYERLADDEIQLLHESIEKIAVRLRDLENFTSEESIPAYSLLNQHFASLHTIWKQFLQDYNAADVKEPDSIQLKDTYKLAVDSVATMRLKEIQAAAEYAIQIDKNTDLTDRINIIVFLLSIFLTSTLGFILIRYTNRSLNQLTLGVNHVAEGDLDYRIPEFSKDELGELAVSFNAMSGRLSQAIEQVQRARENADQANAAKGMFLANMSHELRTPLNAIIGYSDMLSEEIRDDSKVPGEALAADITKISVAGKHLSTLIDNVLDISKVESGKMQINNEWFDASELIHEVVSTIGPLADQNNNAIELSLVEGLSPLYADPTKFRQLFFNLLSNACKFTADGHIEISDRLVNKDERNFVRFSVSDTGIGMNEEQCGKVFESFVQADQSTTKKYGGTGLGLAISRQFCQLMGGDIWVQSEIDVGTTFYIDLPLAYEQEIETSQSDDGGIATAGSDSLLN
ncbi:MAG: sensor histidine kinase [Pseudomonadales bacterium]